MLSDVMLDRNSDLWLIRKCTAVPPPLHQNPHGESHLLNWVSMLFASRDREEIKYRCQKFTAHLFADAHYKKFKKDF